MYVCVCVCVCVRASVRACVRRACMRACMCACLFVSMRELELIQYVWELVVCMCVSVCACIQVCLYGKYGLHSVKQLFI